MNNISSWINCSKNSKNLFVKVVYPGGHVEIYDEPIPASDLLKRNPKCCVAHPTVFHQPHAIVSPTTILALGKKYYVVPVGTIRKLQLKYAPSQRHQPNIQPNDQKDKAGKKHGDHDNKMDISSWLIRNKKNGEKMKNGKEENLKKRSTWISETKKVSSKKVGSKNIAGVGDGGTGARLSLTSDNWQPGLASIIEE